MSSVVVAACHESEFITLDNEIGLLAIELTVTTRATKAQMSIMFASVAMSTILRKRCVQSKIPALYEISKDDKTWYDYLTMNKGAVTWQYRQWT